MKDVIAVLGRRSAGSPIHVELAAYGVEDAGPKKTPDVGLKAIAKAFAECPPLLAECSRLRVEVGSEDNSLMFSLKIGSVTVNISLRADTEMIRNNAEVIVNDCID